MSMLRYTAPSPLNDPLARCLIADGRDIVAKFHWNDANVGYFLQNVSPWEASPPTAACGEVLYVNSHYLLLRCGKPELTRIIEHQLLGKIVADS